MLVLLYPDPGIVTHLILNHFGLNMGLPSLHLPEHIYKSPKFLQVCATTFLLFRVQKHLVGMVWFG